MLQWSVNKETLEGRNQMQRKNRKLYVTISLVAIAGLILTSVAGIFAGAGDFLPAQEQTRQEEMPDLQEIIEGAKGTAAQLAENLRDDPDNIFLLTELGSIYFQIGRLHFMGKEGLTAGVVYFEQAVEVYKKILELEPENVDIRIDMAVAAYYAGDNDLTRETFRAAIAQDPFHPYAHFGYGFFLYHAMEDVVGAISSWEKVLELREGFDPEKYLAVDEGLFDSAANLLEQAIRSLEEEEAGN